MKFNTPWDRIDVPKESGGGERIVETAGYVPLNAQIAQFINAGKRLEDYRSQYDFGLGQPVPEDFIDPTKKKNFDIIDAQDFLEEIKIEAESQKTSEEKKEVIQEVKEEKK